MDCCGEGKILYIPFDLGDVYFNTRTSMVSQYMGKVLRKLRNPIIEVSQKNIDITLQEDGDKVFLNLINMNQGRHSLDILVYDTIPVLHNVEIVIHGSYKDVNMPLGEEYECEYGTDFVKIRLNELFIHSIVELNKAD